MNKVMKYLSGIIFTLVFISLLSSCIDLNCDIRLEEDSSGTISLEYTLPYFASVYNWRESVTYNPLPETIGALNALITATGGLTIIESPFLEYKENGKTISASLRFDRVETLNRFLSGMNEEWSMELAGSNTNVERLTISIAPIIENLDGESRRLLEEFFPDNSIELRLTTPKIPSSYNLGEIDGERDSNTVRFTQNTLDFIGNQFNWEVIW
ncbi:MAG: hypothetical protein JEY99_00630 [Spirochaetales bacterium]|nr:hypothetical protein [Spirochaetales bacterium]